MSMSLATWEIVACLVLGYGLCIGVYELLFWWGTTAAPAIARHNREHEDDIDREIREWGWRR